MSLGFVILLPGRCSTAHDRKGLLQDVDRRRGAAYLDHNMALSGWRL